MMPQLDRVDLQFEGVIPLLYIVAPTTCGNCRSTVKPLQHFVPVVFKESFQAPLLVGYRVELCAACHGLFQSDSEEVKCRTWELVCFIHERITSGEEIPLQIGGELPSRRG